MRLISFVATIIYGILTTILTVFPSIISVGWLSWIAEWWGVVTSFYLFLTALPVAWILLFRSNTKKSWEWPLEHADTTSSFVLSAWIVLAVPLLVWLIPGAMLYWQFKIWLTSAFAAGVDISIALIENVCQRNAPDKLVTPAAPAPAPAPAPAATATTH